MNTLEVRFPGEELASHRNSRGVIAKLFYRNDETVFVGYIVHHDDPSGPAWLEDARGNGLTAADIRRGWPELADAAGLE